MTPRSVQYQTVHGTESTSFIDTYGTDGGGHVNSNKISAQNIDSVAWGYKLSAMITTPQGEQGVVGFTQLINFCTSEGTQSVGSSLGQVEADAEAFSTIPSQQLGGLPGHEDIVTSGGNQVAFVDLPGTSFVPTGGSPSEGLNFAFTNFAMFRDDANGRGLWVPLEVTNWGGADLSP